MRETNVQFLWKMARESAAQVKVLTEAIANLQGQINELKPKEEVKRGPGRPRKVHG